MRSRSNSTLKIAVLAMMAALVFASNYLRITMPIAIGGNTSFTLANIMCCLSGLLLGPIGGLASGLGSALYDLTNPLFVSECWLTFLTKGAMGLGAGLVMRKASHREEPTYLRCHGLLVEGLQPQVALITLGAKVPASLFNSIIAIVAAPILCILIQNALKKAHLRLA